MASKYQEEESIVKKLDSTEVLKNNELEVTSKPPSGLDNINLELEEELDETKKTEDPKVTTDSPEIIIKPLTKESNKFTKNGSISSKSNEPEPEPDPNPEPGTTPTPPVIIIKPFKKK